jgi:hypothetical protein
MSKDEALKLALEALENNKQTHYYCEDTWYSCPKHEDGCANDAEGDECNCGADKTNAEIDATITAIREALAQPEHSCVACEGNPKGNNNPCAVCGLAQPEQEPVCDKDPQGCWSVRCQLGNKCKNTPPQRTWVGLTVDEIKNTYFTTRADFVDYARAIEAKLKERNT